MNIVLDIVSIGITGFAMISDILVANYFSFTIDKCPFSGKSILLNF